MPNGFDCVTRQGDKYERTGTLHGGFQSQGDILTKIQDYMERDKARKDQAKSIHALKDKLKTLKDQERNIHEKSQLKEQHEATLYYLNHQAVNSTDIGSIHE